MSGLNPFTRALLRIADWIAGESEAEWTAAMAAETDAAGAQGLGWALGCVCAAFIMRLRKDWKRMALLLALPFMINALPIAFFFPMVRLMDAGWLPSWGFIALPLFGSLAIIFWAGWSAPGRFPTAFALYLVFILELLPFLALQRLSGGELTLATYFGPTTTIWMMPALWGFLVSLLTYLAALVLGYKAGCKRRLENG